MSDESARRAERDYVPAAPQLWLYDFLVALLTRESRWRPALLRQIDPKAEDSIADIGCGTGTLLALIGRTARSAVLIGVDPVKSLSHKPPHDENGGELHEGEVVLWLLLPPDEQLAEA